MTRCVAFLKAINVGGHTVTMERLRALFGEMGFDGVETFIASGNVLFDTSARGHATLERTIERGLRDALGYDVPTFIRTGPEIVDIADYAPFPEPVLLSAIALNVGFFHEPLGAAACRALAALASDIDSFHVHGRELFWMCRKKQSESPMTGKDFERAIGVPCTLRGINTVRRLSAKMPRGVWK